MAKNYFFIGITILLLIGCEESTRKDKVQLEKIEVANVEDFVRELDNYYTSEDYKNDKRYNDKQNYNKIINNYKNKVLRGTVEKIEGERGYIKLTEIYKIRWRFNVSFNALRYPDSYNYSREDKDKIFNLDSGKVIEFTGVLMNDYINRERNEGIIVYYINLK